MTTSKLTRTFGRIAEISYTPRDLGYGSESDTVTGMLTGEIDTWGKYTLVPADSYCYNSCHGFKYYLFADEITAVRVLKMSELTNMIMGPK